MSFRNDLKEAWREGGKPPDERRDAAPAAPATGQRFEYDVVEIREKLLDAYGSAPTDKLRKLLNDRAREGWQLKHMISGEVAGLVTKRDGWMVIFEREVQSPR
jgi:hypothetical protein